MCEHVLIYQSTWGAEAYHSGVTLEIPSLGCLELWDNFFVVSALSSAFHNSPPFMALSSGFHGNQSEPNCVDSSF